MAITRTIYETNVSNGSSTIAPSASLGLLNADTDMAGKSLYGSFNYLELINDSNCELNIDLDGLSTRRRKLFAKSVIVIRAEEGVFFNNILITNTDGAVTVAANEISGSARICRIIAG